jgi:hypothetical protein
MTRQKTQQEQRVLSANFTYAEESAKSIDTRPAVEEFKK